MNTGEPDLRISYLEHRAMRMDANRLFDQVRRAEPKDDDRLRGISSWYLRYESAIHDHHTAEERVIYPALLERDESFADADGELEGEHRVLADRLTTVRQSLGALPSASGGGRWEAEREEALKAVTALRGILGIHLPHEEAVAFPRYTRSFTADEYDDLGRAAWKVVGPRSVVFAGPWVLDHATSSERAAVLAEQPLLLRLAYRLVLRPRYERVAAPLRPGSVWNVDQTRA